MPGGTRLPAPISDRRPIRAPYLRGGAVADQRVGATTARGRRTGARPWRPAPISVTGSAPPCSTELSCTLAPARTTIRPKSARSTTPYQIEAPASTTTSPTSVAVGAIHASGCTCGEALEGEQRHGGSLGGPGRRRPPLACAREVRWTRTCWWSGRDPRGWRSRPACAGAGVDVLVVDRGAAVGDSWRCRYDRLHLHTPRVQSALPGLRIPAGTAAGWPRTTSPPTSRSTPTTTGSAALRHRGAPPRDGTATAGRRDADGDPAAAAAGGASPPATTATPVQPDWPGQDVLPRRACCTPPPTPTPSRTAASDVLVVGAGNTGAEIAADLAEGGAGAVWLAVRTPPNVVPRQLGPVPTTLLAISMDFSPAWLADPLNRSSSGVFVGDLTRYGLPGPRAGVVTQMRATGVTPTIDVGLIARAPRRAGHAGRRAEPVRRRRRRYSPTAPGWPGRGDRRDRLHDRPRAGGRPPRRARRPRPAAAQRRRTRRPRAAVRRAVQPAQGLLLQINLDARAAATRHRPGTARRGTPARPRGGTAPLDRSAGGGA